MQEQATAGRIFDAARKAQGFRSQAHLGAFYAHFDHVQSCPACGQPGPAMWLEGSASWQPTATECPEGIRLQHISDAHTAGQPAREETASGITITHTREAGTLAHGTERGDGSAEVLKRSGFRWSRNLCAWYVPQSRDRASKPWQIDGAAAALRSAGFEVATEVDDSSPGRTTAEIEAERAGRAEARVERFDGYGASAGQRAASTYARAREMAEAIPFGQPVMGARDRAYRDRMGRTYDRAFTEMGKAEHWAGRTQAAGAQQAHHESIPTTLRRIEKLDAEARQIQRRLDGTDPFMSFGEPATGEWRERLTTRAAEVADQLAYWREHVAQAEASGVKVWRAADISKGDFVRSGREWYEVLRVSAKSVTVPDPLPLVNITRVISREAAQAESDRRGFRRMYTRTMPYDEITASKSAGEMAVLVAEARQRESGQAIG